MQDGLKRIVLITGHYGSGKTTLALNLAIQRAKSEERVVLADLDIVNPYFRSADAEMFLRASGVELVAPCYAGTNLDIPSCSGRLRAVLQDGGSVIIDVGGDAAGAVALGQYYTVLCEAQAYDLLCVVNRYRYLTQGAAEVMAGLQAVEAVARLSATGIVNCSHLGEQTTAATVANTHVWAQKIAQQAGIPLRFAAVEMRLQEALQMRIPQETLYALSVYLRKPWEVQRA